MVSQKHEWSEVESFNHRIISARLYWVADVKKGGKKESKPTTPVETKKPTTPVGKKKPNTPVEPIIDNAVNEELLEKQREFILPLSMALDLDEDFFKKLAEKLAETEAEEPKN